MMMNRRIVCNIALFLHTFLIYNRMVCRTQKRKRKKGDAWISAVPSITSHTFTSDTMNTVLQAHKRDTIQVGSFPTSMKERGQRIHAKSEYPQEG